MFLLEDNSTKALRAGKFIKIDPEKRREKQQVKTFLEMFPICIKLYVWLSKRKKRVMGIIFGFC